MEKEKEPKSIKIEISRIDSEQARDFLRFLRTIQYWGNIGHCGTFKLTVDGDGSWRPRIETNIEGYEDIKPIEEEKGEAKLFIE